MNAISDFFRTVVALLFSLVLMVAGAVFAVSLLLAVVLIVAFGALRALLSGRKPEPVVIWERWRDMQARSKFSARYGTGFGRGGPKAPGQAGAKAADVVDVEARDLPREAPKPGADEPR